jgi:copper chaperone
VKTVELKVSGMSCGHCVHAVKEALAGVSGVTVKDVRVGSASVSYDEERVNVGDLVDAIADAGYEADQAA